jgi:transcriptional regulator with XRE-family HTH domain
MSDFSLRLKKERKRLGMSQEELATTGGVKLNAQSNYENGHRSPDAAYLARVSAVGVDVAYLITGTRTQPARSQAAVDSSGTDAEVSVMRAVTLEEAALLDNYEAADERGRAAARSVLNALAQPKTANG